MLIIRNYQEAIEAVKAYPKYYKYCLSLVNSGKLTVDEQCTIASIAIDAGFSDLVPNFIFERPEYLACNTNLMNNHTARRFSSAALMDNSIMKMVINYAALSELTRRAAADADLFINFVTSYPTKAINWLHNIYIRPSILYSSRVLDSILTKWKIDYSTDLFGFWPLDAFTPEIINKHIHLFPYLHYRRIIDNMNITDRAKCLPYHDPVISGREPVTIDNISTVLKLLSHVSILDPIFDKLANAEFTSSILRTIKFASDHVAVTGTTIRDLAESLLSKSSEISSRLINMAYGADYISFGDHLLTIYLHSERIKNKQNVRIPYRMEDLCSFPLSNYNRLKRFHDIIGVEGTYPHIIKAREALAMQMICGDVITYWSGHMAANRLADVVFVF